MSNSRLTSTVKNWVCADYLPSEGWGKVMFTQVCVHPQGEFQVLSQVFSGGYPSPGGGGNPVWGTPYPGQDGVPPPLARSGRGTPPPPGTEQQSEYLLHGGRYPSCGNVGGLSCYLCLSITAEYDGYDDVYGHSVEEADFCISPGTGNYRQRICIYGLRPFYTNSLLQKSI